MSFPMVIHPVKIQTRKMGGFWESAVIASYGVDAVFRADTNETAVKLARDWCASRNVKIVNEVTA